MSERCLNWAAVELLATSRARATVCSPGFAGAWLQPSSAQAQLSGKYRSVLEGPQTSPNKGGVVAKKGPKHPHNAQQPQSRHHTGPRPSGNDDHGPRRALTAFPAAQPAQLSPTRASAWDGPSDIGAAKLATMSGQSCSRQGRRHRHCPSDFPFASLARSPYGGTGPRPSRRQGTSTSPQKAHNRTAPAGGAESPDAGARTARGGKPPRPGATQPSAEDPQARPNLLHTPL